MIMRTITLALFSILTLRAYSETEKSTPDFYCSPCNSDTGLTKQEGLFGISFTSNEGEVTGPVKFSCNGVITTVVLEKDKRTTVNVSPGKYRFQFFYTTNFYEITTDSVKIEPGCRIEAHVNFKSSITQYEVEKPVIYVYAPAVIQVSIELDIKGKLGFTYPDYNNGWNFIARPGGDISMGDKKYHYLFYDGAFDMDPSKLNWNEGFEVGKGSLVAFLEEKLAKMGLNTQEIQDYITYWMPRMNVNAVNYIHFLFNDEYNAYSNLQVTPKPDNLFRVFMIWKKADEESTMEMKPQQLPSFYRAGLTVVEWGGMEVRTAPLK
jgi:hypothetical protein